MILVQKVLVVKLGRRLALDRGMGRYYHDLLGAGFPRRFPVQALGGRGRSAERAMGISPVVGRLTLAQEAEVRILDPQPLCAVARTGSPISRTKLKPR